MVTPGFIPVLVPHLSPVLAPCAGVPPIPGAGSRAGAPPIPGASTKPPSRSHDPEQVPGASTKPRSISMPVAKAHGLQNRSCLRH